MTDDKCMWLDLGNIPEHVMPPEKYIIKMETIPRHYSVSFNLTKYVQDMIREAIEKKDD